MKRLIVVTSLCVWAMFACSETEADTTSSPSAGGGEDAGAEVDPSSDAGSDAGKGDAGPKTGSPDAAAPESMTIKIDGVAKTLVRMDALLFTNSNKFQVTGIWKHAVNAPESDSVSIQFLPSASGALTCNATDTQVIHTNANPSGSSYLYYSSEYRIADCAINIVAVGAVGQRAKGTFDALVQTGPSTGPIHVEGSFDLVRDPDM